MSVASVVTERSRGVASVRRIAAIFRKDLLDAIRDARIWFAVLIPLSVGIFYHVVVDDDVTAEPARLAIAGDERSALPATIAEVLADLVEVEIRFDDAPAVRAAVDANEVDLGLMLAPDFDARLQAGEAPEVAVVAAPDASYEANLLVAALEPALDRLAGRAPVASITMEATAPAPPREATIFDRLGPRRYLVLVSLVLTVVMIGMYAVPIMLNEETEKNTIEALQMVARDREIVAAKGALGLLYIAIASTLLILITDIRPERPATFVLGLGTLATSTIAIGLLVGGLFRSASQLSTWSGIFMLPLVVPVFLIGANLPDRLERVVSLTPTVAGLMVIVDAVVDPPLYERTAQSFTVMAVWVGLSLLALLALLSRRRRR